MVVMRQLVVRHVDDELPNKLAVTFNSAVVGALKVLCVVLRLNDDFVMFQL